MISQLLIILLLAAAPVDKIKENRRAYSICLTALVRDEAAAKTKPDAFDAKLATACKAQEAAFRDAVVVVDVAAGIKRAAAEENASTEINDYLGNAKENYRNYIDPPK